MCSDRSGGVGLVASDSVRSRAWPPWAAPGDAEVIHEHREHRRVTGLSGPDEHDQRQPPTIDEVMDLRAQPAAGPADRVVRGLLAQILVTRQSPLCRAEGSWRADAPEQSWRQRKRSSRSFLPRQPRPAHWLARDPRCHQRHSDDGASIPFATDQNPLVVDLARESRSDSDRRSPPLPDDDHRTDALDDLDSRAVTVRPEPSPHPRTPRNAKPK